MDKINDYSELRAPEYQSIIIIDYDDGRMFPLTEECPKCMLPIGNRKLLAYQLDMLVKSGALEVFIVAPREYESQIAHFLSGYVRENISIDLVVVDEMMGSADGLRAVSDRIRGDFICLSSDFISQFTLVDITHMHRLKTSDLTMMFTVVPKEAKKDEVDQEYVGITEEGRVVFKTPTLEIDEAVTLSKPLLHRAPGLSLRNNLMDLGIYVMSHWVMEFVKSNHRISSIRTDLVPYFIQRQFQPASYLYGAMPALQHRRRPLHALESWLVSRNKTTEVNELMTHVIDNFKKAANANSTGTTVDAVQDSANDDLLRCFGLVYDLRPAPGAGPPAAQSVKVMTRITNIVAYQTINKDIPNHSFDASSPWSRLANYQKKELSLVGDGADLSAKNVTYKQSSIGSHVTVGAMSKLNNCVVMDNVVIGENCTLQNCVISEKAVVESNCNLNDCHIGHGYRVPAGTKQKNELFSSSH